MHKEFGPRIEKVCKSSPCLHKWMSVWKCSFYRHFSLSKDISVEDNNPCCRRCTVGDHRKNEERRRTCRIYFSYFRGKPGICSTTNSAVYCTQSKPYPRYTHTQFLSHQNISPTRFRQLMQAHCTVPLKIKANWISSTDTTIFFLVSSLTPERRAFRSCTFFLILTYILEQWSVTDYR